MGGMGLPGPMGGGSTARPGAEIKVFVLEHASAEELTVVLERVFGDQASITPAPRGNQLVIKAEEQTLSEVAALLIELDVPPKKKN